MKYTLTKKGKFVLSIGILCIALPIMIYISNIVSSSLGSTKTTSGSGVEEVTLKDKTSVNEKESSNRKSLEEAVSLVIKDQHRNYGLGEFNTEGHILLDFVDSNGVVNVYTIASFGAFGFENGIFTKVSGSGAIPTVITFSRNSNGEYRLLTYREPLDGAGYNKSIKQIFPRKLWDKVLKNNQYPVIWNQQEKQAKEYLKDINREAKVSSKFVEKKLLSINGNAANKLFSVLPKNNPELINFPYWKGTKEALENGVRYLYETSQLKDKDKSDLILFRKTREDGTLIKEYIYKINGSEPELILGR